MCKIIIDGEERVNTPESAKWSDVKSVIQGYLSDHYYVDYVEIKTHTASNNNNVYCEIKKEAQKYNDSQYQEKINTVAKRVAENMKEKGLIDNSKNDL